MCTDFTNLNKVCPNEQEKTTFIMDYGLYCWKNLVNHLFKEQIGRNMEIYVDDMLVKSRRRADHLGNLTETLERPKPCRLHINPKKYTFGVTSGKFLDYMLKE
ncbi:hypothetical protein LIER_22174 [Lithospermum erythrorhizon]|uniref:Reverse transcriptase domain-containing protein n=1 Tax=Lithospermum erythrorhizon TaxID=34254 RepID=A0AAV3QT23_LITER